MAILSKALASKAVGRRAWIVIGKESKKRDEEAYKAKHHKKYEVNKKEMNNNLKTTDSKAKMRKHNQSRRTVKA